MNNIRIKKMTHRCRCQVPGCRNRDALKISRRDDVNGRPMFLCPECIKGIYGLYDVMFGCAGAAGEETEITEEETKAIEEVTEITEEVTETTEEVTEITKEETKDKAENAETNRAKSNSAGKRNSGAKK